MPRAATPEVPGAPDELARAIAAACGDREVLARLAGPLGEAARAASAGWVDGMARARWGQAARTAVPPGLRGVHPSWIEAGLAGLPERARAAVAAGGGDAVDVWLARWATAGIPPMPAVTEARVASVASATRVDAPVLVAWLEGAGADQLAFALGSAGGDAIGAAAQLVGEPLHAATARIQRAPRAGALGPLRAAVARCRVTLDERALLRIGARAVAPYLDPLARTRIAHRLPRPLGLAIAQDMAGAARVAPAQAPRWAALVAPLAQHE